MSVYELSMLKGMILVLRFLGQISNINPEGQLYKDCEKWNQNCKKLIE